MLPPWSEMRAGTGCPLCAPRPPISEHTYLVCKLSVSSLYLSRNQAYRGACALVYDPAHVTRPSELDLASWQQLCSDIRSAEAAVTSALQPDHVNIECLGNTVPHLHVGLTPRYTWDPRWGGPIWTTSRAEMPQMVFTDAACDELAQLLRAHIPGAA
jgi:diadenosine tetraphosphate (Ap4A) HIT family hydrolase